MSATAKDAPTVETEVSTGGHQDSRGALKIHVGEALARAVLRMAGK